MPGAHVAPNPPHPTSTVGENHLQEASSWQRPPSVLFPLFSWIFLPGGLGRVGALGAWHCARDPGQAGEASNLAESSQGPAPHPIFRALAPSSNPTFGRMT